MALKDRIRSKLSSRPTPATTSPASSSSISPTTTQASSRSGSSTSLNETTLPISQIETLSALHQTATTATLMTSATNDTASLKLTKTTSSLKSISKRFSSMRRERTERKEKEKYNRRYDPAQAARLSAWQWNDGARRLSTWSAVSPNTSRRGSAMSGYAVKQEIEAVEVERRLATLMV